MVEGKVSLSKDRIEFEFDAKVIEAEGFDVKSVIEGLVNAIKQQMGWEKFQGQSVMRDKNKTWVFAMVNQTKEKKEEKEKEKK